MNHIHYIEIKPITAPDYNTYCHLLYGLLIKGGAPIVIEKNMFDKDEMRYRATAEIHRKPLLNTAGNWVFWWETA